MLFFHNRKQTGFPDCCICNIDHFTLCWRIPADRFNEIETLFRKINHFVFVSLITQQYFCETGPIEVDSRKYTSSHELWSKNSETRKFSLEMFLHLLEQNINKSFPKFQRLFPSYISCKWSKEPFLIWGKIFNKQGFSVLVLRWAGHLSTVYLPLA